MRSNKDTNPDWIPECVATRRDERELRLEVSSVTQHRLPFSKSRTRVGHINRLQLLELTYRDEKASLAARSLVKRQ